VKRFVGTSWGIVILVVVATVAVVIPTEANGGAAQLIMVGFLTIAILWDKAREPREGDSKEPTGGGCSKGSR